jgi:hypothetical protein
MDTRPTIDSPEVITAYAALVRDAILAGPGQAWKKADDAKVLTHLSRAITVSGDAFQRALYLQIECKWVCSQEVVDLLHTRTKMHEKAHCSAEEAWVMKTGVRSPVKEGDRVRFASESNVDWFGKVEAILKSRGKVVVRTDGTGIDVETPVTLEEKVDQSAVSALHVVPVERLEAIYTGKKTATPIISVTRMAV